MSSISSQSPSPANPIEFYEPPHERNGLLQSPNGVHSVASPSAKVTRTVAIIKTNALEQRLDIEHRLLEANFEIVKERQMEFDTETDPDTFFELFGDDARFLDDGPVWVYVLERRRAVQVLLTLMPSLDDAIIGAKDEEQAEIQIASLFASSPPFPTSDLPAADEELGSNDEYDPGSVRSIDSAILEALKLGLSAPPGTLTPTSVASDARAPQFSARQSLSSNGSPSGKQPFRARPLPKTHLTPDISPRTTKAALLRQGLAADGSKVSPLKSRMSTASTGRIPLPRREKENAAEKEIEKERIKKTFAGVPGHKRSETLTVASTAPPTIAPRLTKAAALRLGLAQPALPPGRRRASIAGSVTNGKAAVSTNEPATSSQKSGLPSDAEREGEDTETERGRERKNIFDGVPGHKRRQSISVASTTEAPSIVPRTNRTAALRKQGGPPPSSFMFRTSSTPKVPGSAGTQSRSSTSLSAYIDSAGTDSATRTRPSSTVPSRASSRVSHVAPRASLNKTSSYSSQTSESSAVSTTSTASVDELDKAALPQRSVRRLSSLQAPSIAPRANRSAILRAQKLAEEAAKPKSPWANASKR
jgi:nucleoside diphosphate kinase